MPCAAADQRALMDPLLEGERALHHLETAPPPAVLDQLLVAAAAAAPQLLAACPGGHLPSAAAGLRSCATRRPSLTILGFKSRFTRCKELGVLQYVIALGYLLH